MKIRIQMAPMRRFLFVIDAPFYGLFRNIVEWETDRVKFLVFLVNVPEAA